jgi:hypothetical protein
MKIYLLFSLAFILSMSAFSANAQAVANQGNAQQTTAVEVYYFHFTHRCSTCLSVEETAKGALEKLYADKVKSGEYTFKSLNLDDDAVKALAQKLGVGGQSLLVVSGTQKVDITSQGFMNAHNPEKMQQEVKKAVEKVIKG